MMSLPAAPLAKPMHVSLVLVSPSTVICKGPKNVSRTGLLRAYYAALFAATQLTSVAAGVSDLHG